MKSKNKQMLLTQQQILPSRTMTAKYSSAQTDNKKGMNNTLSTRPMTGK